MININLKLMKSNKSSFTYRGVKYNQNDISSSDSRLSNGIYRGVKFNESSSKKSNSYKKKGLYRGVEVSL